MNLPFGFLISVWPSKWYIFMANKRIVLPSLACRIDPSGNVVLEASHVCPGCHLMWTLAPEPAPYRSVLYVLVSQRQPADNQFRNVYAAGQQCAGEDDEFHD